ncbi:hypothetical protein CVT25_012756 [Psilocybe cyanescens]|uniref:Uncharacterized protein n=1 Tax=Psilocybe cyanescens TaxID=93625 RepID=A0A409X4I2_PSICY|nr:hypothetical protein CVT25_012756 [Psilocybe cyanescens]
MSTIKLKHVPLLENAASYPGWKRHISQVLKDEGYWGHIKGTVNLWDLYPISPEPKAPTAVSNSEYVVSFHKCWQEDSKARGIMLRRVSQLVFDNLQVADGVSARTLWQRISSKYVRIDINAQFEIKERLSTLKLKDHKDFDNYIAEFRTGRERLLAMSVHYPESDVIHHILCGLPSSQSWTNFKQLMVQLYQDHMDREKVAFDEGKDAAAPDTLLDHIVSRLLIECQRIEAESPSKRNGPGSEYSNLAKDTDNRPIAKHPNNPNGVRCTNCRDQSHDRDHCFNSGGGMAGQAPRDKATAAAAAAAATTSKNNGKEVASIAAVDFLDDGEISCAMIESVGDNLSALALTSIPANTTLLDSGATSHLIKSREMFHSYSEANARNVTTANLGTLRTQGGGTCYVNVSYEGRTIRLKLNNCLHAPGAAVNLLSVGCLNSAGISCNFLPNEGIRLSKNGIIFASGQMINRLFSLNADFIPRSPLDECIMFAKVPESMYLHHLRLGHPGENATRTLVKSILKSEIKDLEPIKCEPCIIAKHVATPHPPKSVGQHTFSPLKLLVGDTCGPFPVETPHRKKYFVAF